MIRQGTPFRAASKMGATVGRSCSISSSIASMPIISTRKRSLSMRTSFVSLPVISPLSPGKWRRVGEDHYRPAYHIGDKGVVAYHGNDRAGDNEPLELSQPILSGTVFQEAYGGVTHRVSNEKEVIPLTARRVAVK